MRCCLNSDRALNVKSLQCISCDISLIISTFEMKFLKEVFKIPQSIAVSFTIFCLIEIDEAKVNSWKPFDERHHFVSIGNFHSRTQSRRDYSIKKSRFGLSFEKALLRCSRTSCLRSLSNSASFRVSLIQMKVFFVLWFC